MQGGGEAIHRKQRQQKMPAQHIETRHCTKTAPAWPWCNSSTCTRLHAIYMPVSVLQTPLYLCSQKRCILVGSRRPIRGEPPPHTHTHPSRLGFFCH